MAGTITHYWNGSVLTVTSDSGTSSANLAGPTGCRGPQGRPGVVYDEEGNLVVGDYASGAEVDVLTNRVATLEDRLDEAVDMTGYATQNYVDTQIAQAQLEGAEVDLSGYVTQDELDAAIADINIDSSATVAVDGKTILQRADGTIATAIGGSLQEGAMFHTATELNYVPRHWVTGGSTYDSGPVTNTGTAFCEGIYHIIVTFSDGFVEDREVDCALSGDEYAWDEYYNGGQPQRLSYFGGDANGDVYLETRNYDCIVTAIKIEKGGYIYMDANFIPVDGSTVYINDEGQLACAIQVGEDGTIDLSNYYTKSEIDALLASSSNLASSEEVSY